MFSPQSLHCRVISIQRYSVGLAKEQRVGGVRREEERRERRWAEQEKEMGKIVIEGRQGKQQE